MFTVFDEELARTAREIRDRHRSYAAGRWTEKELTVHQLDALRTTVDYVKKNSPFYRRHLADVDPQSSTRTRSRKPDSR